jgi:hypothetical protein
VYARRRWFVTVNTNSYDSLFHSILVLTSEAGKCGGTDVYCIKLVRCGGKKGVLTEEKGEEKADKSLYFPPKREIYIRRQIKICYSLHQINLSMAN